MGRIQEFYASKTVLVTGATGFLGGILLERLLSSCPDLKEIFVVARPRKGQSPVQRLQFLLSLPLFRNLGEEVKKKVTLLTGDVSMPNIGLSWTDIERIKERVQVVFHVAAIVNFSAALDKAVITNVGGTAALLALAKDMTNLEAMVYVSTAYCNCTVDGFVEEKVYQSRWDPVEFLRDVMESPSEEINRRKRELIGNHPNTYSFSKQLAENLIAQEGGDLPIAIIRPSIVLNTAERPIEGWTYNVLSGAFAFIAGAGRGAFRTIYADGNAVADHVPSDYFIAFLIAAAWKTAVHRNFQVYHYTSGTVRPILWSDYLSTVMKYMDKYPTANTVIPPRAKCRKGYIHNWFVVLLFHYLPALILDLLDVSLDVPFRFWEIQKKYSRGMFYTSYFTLNQWLFTADNQMDVWKEMDEEDKNEFRFNMENFNWDSYIKTCVLGVRRYFHNQSDISLKIARYRYSKTKSLYYWAWFVAYSFMVLFFQLFTSTAFSLCCSLFLILILYFI
ncbi:putative fatty acyl-CoA reductase CG8303 [Halyomorpha halys]|uniref:putative fatty acyl-CoA reductase CG8303 n=1 Tax=Halyomorpha halys TaxID=286706 RepID=UPI0006D4E3F3